MENNWSKGLQKWEQEVLLLLPFLETPSHNIHYCLSTCISTISKFDTIQYRSNLLFRILLRFDIYRTFYIEFQLDKIHNFEFSISNFDIAYVNTVKTYCRWRYRKREKESKERKRETKRQRDKMFVK